MEIAVIDFLRMVGDDELFDVYVNGIHVGEVVGYSETRWKYFNSELPLLLDDAMRCNVIKVDFRNRRIFAEDAE